MQGKYLNFIGFGYVKFEGGDKGADIEKVTLKKGTVTYTLNKDKRRGTLLPVGDYSVEYIGGDFYYMNNSYVRKHNGTNTYTVLPRYDAITLKNVD